MDIEDELISDVVSEEGDAAGIVLSLVVDNENMGTLKLLLLLAKFKVVFAVGVRGLVKTITEATILVV